jgi:transposase
MTTETIAGPATRFVALDVHRQYVMVGAVDVQQHVVLAPRRFGFEAFAQWAPAHLTHADAVVLEATANAWLFYDQLQPLAMEVIVAHPQAVKLIAAARVKTDSRDTIKLASRLPANLIPAVWVPPQEVRELRALVAHRKRLVQQRTQAGNRLHGVLHRHNLAPPPGKPFAAHQRAWWLALDLSSSEKLRIQQDLQLHQTLEALVDEVEVEHRRLSTCDSWVRACSLPGAVTWSGRPLGDACVCGHWPDCALSFRPRIWLAMLEWELQCMIQVRHIEEAILPKRVAVICVR